MQPKTYKPVSSALSKEELGTLINSIRLFYKFVDTLEFAPDEVIVFPETVKPIADEANTFEAVVKIVKEYCGPKSHKVHIKFKAKNHKILPPTLTYL